MSLLNIITPSYINSDNRLKMAMLSLQSLQQNLGVQYEHIVVDDVPRMQGGIGKWLPDPRFMNACTRVYTEKNIHVFRQYGAGSNPATLRAVREARQRGADLAFIHLDDQVYVPVLKTLVEHAIDAFGREPLLKCVHLSNYPLINKACTRELGNRTHIGIKPDEIIFDRIHLKPSRFFSYTLWHCPLFEGMIDGNYWPAALWLAVYRSDFLESLLTLDKVPGLSTLGEVESFYRDKNNWRKILQQTSGKVGYINMQFGGFEMHRNKNWQDLICLPNNPIL